LPGIARVRVSLRVFGDALEPDEVSALLGRQPSRSHRKGEGSSSVSKSASSGSSTEPTSEPTLEPTSEPTSEPTGVWILDSGLSGKAEIEEHVEALLSLVSNDSDEWASLTSRFSASILCSACLDEYNEGFEISPRLAQSLADRGLVIAFDIYSGDAGA